jgi:predicted RNase H-like HicB family nuclease
LLAGAGLGAVTPTAFRNGGGGVIGGLSRNDTKTNVYFSGMKIQNKKTLHLPILVEQDEDGVYIVSCPSFQGCHSYGKTIDEALTNIGEVIDMCLEEIPVREINRFIGFRELEVKVA